MCQILHKKGKEMARRRMFSLDIIDTDLFIEMPQTSRLLYYELCMRADDDGFVSSPKKIQKMVGCSDDDFKVLITKKFIIPFDTGIVVIRHWKIHNYIQKDRYKETIYLDEKKHLNQEENGMYIECIQDGYSMDTQVRLGKDSIDKDSKDKSKKEKNKKETEFDQLINQNFTDEELKNTIYEFIKMRKAIKKPLTTRGLELMIKKLYSLSANIDEQIQILNNSIMNNWQGIFPLTKETKKEKTKQQNQYEQRKYTENELNKLYANSN